MVVHKNGFPGRISFSGNPCFTRMSKKEVDYGDFSVFAQYWQDFCPNGWKLK
jgi:hypothetical protein